MTRLELEESREKTRQILLSGKWLSEDRYRERNVEITYDGSFHCWSWDRFDPEFTTKDIDEAIDYLYPYEL